MPTFTLEDAVVTGNEAPDADGGGVGVYRGSLTIEGSTISGNIAGNGGGWRRLHEIRQ